MALVSLRGYARHRGVSLRAVQKSIESGRIQKTPDGKIDTEQADAQWEQNTAPRAGKMAKFQKPTVVHRTGPDKVPSPVRAESGAGGVPDYARTRAVHETYKARLTRLEYEKRIQKLLPADEVKIAAFNKARTVRDHLFNVADRIAAQLRAQLATALGVGCQRRGLGEELVQEVMAEISVEDIHTTVDSEIRTALIELTGPSVEDH